MPKLQGFITSCTITFKTFGFDITMNKAKTTVWNFTAFNPKGDKKYCVLCSSSITKSKGLIKVASKKLPPEHRLVLIVDSHSEQELADASKQNYTLVSLETLNNYGEEMLRVREAQNARTQRSIAREVKAEVDKSSEEFIDKVINKDNLF